MHGWPIPVGGSQSIANFLLEKLKSYGIFVECNRYIAPDSLPPEVESADIVLWDTDPALAIQASQPDSPLPVRKYGSGVEKVDFVTNSPIPWSNPRLKQAGTIHLSGSWNEISLAEKSVNSGGMPSHPFTLVS